MRPCPGRTSIAGKKKKCQITVFIIIRPDGGGATRQGACPRERCLEAALMENVLTEWLATYYDEVEPLQFYREIFPVGTMQPSSVYLSGVYNGIIVSVTKEKRPDGKTRIKRYTVTDELTAIDEVCRGDILVDILLWSENYLKKQEKRCKMSNIFIDTLRPL